MRLQLIEAAPNLNSDLNCPIIYSAISPNSLMKATMIYEVAMLAKISSFRARLP